MEFYVVEYSKELWEHADEKARSLPVYKGSHRGFQANQVGCLGEVVAARWLEEIGVDFTNETHLTTHDFKLLDSTTIDVKTKDPTAVPRLHYECSAPLYNHDHQRPGIYLFVSLLRIKSREYGAEDIRRYRKAYLLGGMTLERFDEMVTVKREAEIDPSNGIQFWTACGNVYIRDLDPLKTMSSRWMALRSLAPTAVTCDDGSSPKS